MFANPEPLDEDDPEVLEEMFEMHKYRGLKPADLPGATQEYRAKYAAWLKSQEA
jgi:hypothetical protein